MSNTLPPDSHPGEHRLAVDMSPWDQAISATHWQQLSSLLTILADLQETTLELPKQPAETLASTIRAVARFADVPIVSVQLPPRWHDIDFGPLLCLQSDDDRGTLCLLWQPRKGQHWRIDADGTRTRITSRTLAKIDGTAWSLVRTYASNQNGNAGAGGSRVSPQGIGLRDMLRFAMQPLRSRLWWLPFVLAITIALGFATPLALQQIIDKAIPVADVRFLYSVVSLLICFHVAHASLVFFRSKTWAGLQTRLTSTLQAATWWHVTQLRPGDRGSCSSGEVVYRSMLVSSTSWGLGQTVVQAGLSSLVAVSMIGVALWLSPKLLAIALPLALIEACLLSTLTALSRQQAKRMEADRALLNGQVTSAMQGIVKIRAAGGAATLLRNALTSLRFVVSKDLTLTRLEDLRAVISIVLPALATLLVLSTGFKLCSLPNESMSIGTFAAFLAAYRTFTSGITGLATLAAEVIGATAQLELIKPMLSAAPVCYRGRTDVGQPQGTIEFSGVTFHYPGDREPTLRDATFKIGCGEFIGITGDSGSGKSTAMRLLLGLEEQYFGKIFLDGVEIRSIDMRQVRPRIGVVPQSARLIHGTVRDNVLAGRIIDSEQVWKTLELVCMSQEITALPLGLDTIVSEGGANLSGGQAQRLLLARALLANPRLIIVDEVLSGLDVRQQMRILDRLRADGRTLVMVTHRLRAVQSADRIFHFRNGTVQQLAPLQTLT